jgi:HEAT repeat protein
MPGAWVGAALTAELESNRHAGLRVKLAGILGLRKEVSALPVLMKLWPGADPTLQAAALQAISGMGTEQELTALVAALAAADDAALRRGLAQAAQEIALRRSKPSVAILMEGLKPATGGNRGELIRILGRLGGAEALAAIRAELKSEQSDVRRSAVHALSSWKSMEPLTDLLAVAKTDADPGTQLLALRRFIAMTTAATALSNEDRAAHLKSAFPLATRREEKRSMLEALISIPSPSAIELARSALTQPDVAADARRVLMQIDSSWITELLKNLRLTASANPGAAKNALDGNLSTRWDTGRGMQAGDWFQVDLGETKKVAGLVVDAGSSKVDYARGLDVLTSPDGETWTKIVSIPDNKEPVLPVSFPAAVSTRYLRLVQTGNPGGGLHWSIHEIRLDIEE